MSAARRCLAILAVLLPAIFQTPMPGPLARKQDDDGAPF
jgi:hypothetical protein